MCVVCVVCVCRAERVCRFVVSKSLGLSEEDRIRVSHFVHQLIKEGVVKREHFMQSLYAYVESLYSTHCFH